MPTPTPWEYKIVDVDTQQQVPYNQIFEKVLNHHGREGWEHYHTDQGTGGARLFLKRPK